MAVNAGISIFKVDKQLKRSIEILKGNCICFHIHTSHFFKNTLVLAPITELHVTHFMFKLTRTKAGNHDTVFYWQNFLYVK